MKMVDCIMDSGEHNCYKHHVVGALVKSQFDDNVTSIHEIIAREHDGHYERVTVRLALNLRSGAHTRQSRTESNIATWQVLDRTMLAEMFHEMRERALTTLEQMEKKK